MRLNGKRFDRSPITCSLYLVNRKRGGSKNLTRAYQIDVEP